MAPMTSPHDYSESVRQAWAGHESFRRLGFRPADIFVIVARSVNNNGKFAMHSTLRAQGREFNIVCGVYESQEAAEKDLQAFASYRKNFMSRNFSEADLHSVLQAALQSWGGSTALVMALMDKGFTIPRTAR